MIVPARNLHSFSTGLAAGLVLAVCGAAHAASSTAAATAAPEVARDHFEVVLERPLPADLRFASDVRWASDDAVWVAAGPRGVFEVPLEAGPARRRLGAGGEPPDGLLLAASDGMVAAAVGFGPVSWAPTSPPNTTGRSSPLATIVDFDLWQGRAVFLGARRGADGTWSPDGGILWTGSLANGFADVEALMYSESGARAEEMARCGLLGLGAVRFFADGRYAIVPGVQPGAFLYAADGKLLHAWKTESLGFYDRCDLDWDEARSVKRDPRARIRWWRSHSTLDEVVPWGEWPALIVRRPRADGTSWQLVVLSEGGGGEPIDLPISSASTGSHLKADLHGDRLVVLVSEFGPPDEPPQEPPRLVVLQLAGRR